MAYCQAILKYSKEQFRRSECGLHAGIIKGIKCERGKYKYLIQNSWGKDEVALNPAIETEIDQGAYWFDEQTFYDSASEIHVVSFGEKE